MQVRGRLTSRASLTTAYTYTSTEILEAPLCTPENFCDPFLTAGNPLRRRPKHSGNILLTYVGSRWGANLGGSFVGRRPDSDFFGLGFNHAAGYASSFGWYAIKSRITATRVSIRANSHYNEVRDTRR